MKVSAADRAAFLDSGVCNEAGIAVLESMPDIACLEALGQLRAQVRHLSAGPEETSAQRFGREGGLKAARNMSKEDRVIRAAFAAAERWQTPKAEERAHALLYRKLERGWKRDAKGVSIQRRRLVSKRKTGPGC
jgi:hypothetical protein